MDRAADARATCQFAIQACLTYAMNDQVSTCDGIQCNGSMFPANGGRRDYLIHERPVILVSKTQPIRMIRHDLSELLEFRVPSPFSVSWYRPGDGEVWTSIERAVEGPALSGAAFREQFGDDESALSARMFFLCAPDGPAVATATAWYDDCYRGLAFGRIHWVAVLPPYQRRGLGNCLLSIACRRLRDLGHERAYLLTDTGRLAAVALYLKFGFVPALDAASDRLAWRELEATLHHPAITRALRG